MGRPPLHAAAMSKREIDARHRRTAAQEIAALRHVVVNLMKDHPHAMRMMHKFPETISRAYAAQKKET